MSVARPKTKTHTRRPDTKPKAQKPQAKKDGPDPRSPLVLDVRDLGRNPGSMLQLDRDVPAPADLGVPMIGVPEGATMHLDGRLEAVVEGVLVTVRVSVPLHGECGRCLEEFDDSKVVRIQELFCYPERLEDMGVEEDDDVEELLLVEGDLIDLEPVLRDAVVLSLPMNPLCSPDCAGLAFDGGPVDEPAEESVIVDARWAALQALAVEPGESR